MKKIMWLILVTFLLAAAVIVGSGCVGSAYAYSFAETEMPIKTTPSEDRDIMINGHNYHCFYQESRISVYFDEIIDSYSVGGGNAMFDRKTGELIYLGGIKPFDPIADKEKLTDEELVEAVKERLDGLFDFSKYNDCSFGKFGSSDPKYCQFYADWFFDNGVKCNRILRVSVNDKGEIYTVSKTDAYLDSFEIPDVTDEEIENTARKTAKERFGLNDPKEIVINERILTAYHGDPALYIRATAYDEGGFPYVLSPIFVYKKR